MKDPFQATIAPLWDDWRTDQSADDSVLAKFEDTSGDGVPDRLIVEWNQVRRHSDPGPVPQVDVTFQAVLALNTGSTPAAIVFNYRDLDTGSLYSNGGDATVGIKGSGDQTTTGNRLLISARPGQPPVHFQRQGHPRRAAFGRGGREVPVLQQQFLRRRQRRGQRAGRRRDRAGQGPLRRQPRPGHGPRHRRERASTFANVSSYSRGINGVMVDMAYLFGKTPVASDFDVATGSSLAGAWAAAPVR